MSLPRDERGRLEPELIGDYYDELEAERASEQPPEPPSVTGSTGRDGRRAGPRRPTPPLQGAPSPEAAQGLDDLPEGWR